MESKQTCTIGKGITIKGKVRGEEDLVVQGVVEGSMILKNHIRIEGTAVINANIESNNILVIGEINGDLVAADKISISSEAKVNGVVRAPRVVIEEGARFTGTIDMDVKLPANLIRT